MELERRRVATQATLNEYRGTTFDWEAQRHCVRFARDHLVNMGRDVPELPTIRTPISAMRALKRKGWSSVGDMLDKLLGERIPPAKMWLGDLAVVPGQDGLDAILVCAGPLKMMGWHPDSGDFVIYDNAMREITGAWRV